MNEDDFIYYKDNKNNLMSGGFSMNLLALKNGLSPLSGGTGKGEGLHDTDYSQQFKDHIIPSFLHYQLAGEHDNYSHKMSELLNVYEDHNDNADHNDNNENADQDGGDLYEKLLDLVTMNKSSKSSKSSKNINKNKISRKKIGIKNTKNNKKTKKNKVKN